APGPERRRRVAGLQQHLPGQPRRRRRLRRQGRGQFPPRRVGLRQVRPGPVPVTPQEAEAESPATSPRRKRRTAKKTEEGREEEEELIFLPLLLLSSLLRGSSFAPWRRCGRFLFCLHRRGATSGLTQAGSASPRRPASRLR